MRYKRLRGVFLLNNAKNNNTTTQKKGVNKKDKILENKKNIANYSWFDH